MQVSKDTESVIDTAARGIAGIDYQVLGIAHHYQLECETNGSVAVAVKLCNVLTHVLSILMRNIPTL